MSGKVMTPKRRKELGRGQKIGEEYEPFIKPKEARSAGVASNIPDAETNKMKSTLSQGEAAWYFRLWFQDDVVEIQEQKLLDQDLLDKICDKYGKKHIHYASTDLYVIRADGTKEAYSIKVSEDKVQKPRVKERIAIEKLYWDELGVKFFLKFKTDIPKQEMKNYIDIYPYQDEKKVHDIYSRIRHLIATKKIRIDMTKTIDYEAIKRDYSEEIKGC